MAMSNPLPVLPPDERVLSTLESDGRRRWLTPRLAPGRFWSRRRLVAYGLIALYAALPFIKIGGRPALQLDLWNGRASILGLDFRPTDLELLAVFGLIVFLGVFFLTAIFGRVWCGWACPQTVYLECVFRPIERLFLGTAGKGGKPKKPVAAWRVAAMYAVFFVICLHLANTFLAYFVGADTLHRWIWTEAPWRHPGAFLLVASVTGLMLFDFCYWREQLCIIGCPYGRFQSVLLDRSSLIVGYDARRGEPRGRGRDRKAKGLGDCVNCGMCVDVCPTGIDIRDGLQLECVNCTQCIDACDAVMDRVKRPRGLIRYSSQSGLDGKPTSIVRPRVVIYSCVLVGLTGLLLTLLASRSAFDVSLLSRLGRPFVGPTDGVVENTVRVNLVNRVEETRVYRVEAVEPASVRVEGLDGVSLAPGETTTEALRLLVPAEAFAANGGVLKTTLRFFDDAGAEVRRSYRLLGPARYTPPAAEPKAGAADSGASESGAGKADAAKTDTSLAPADTDQP